MVGPAPVAQVTDLQLHVFPELLTSLPRLVLLNLVLDLSRVHQVEPEEGDS